MIDSEIKTNQNHLVTLDHLLLGVRLATLFAVLIFGSELLVHI